VSGYFFAVVPPEPTLGAIEAFRTRWGNPHHNVEPHVTVKAPFEWDGSPEPFLAPARAACAALRPFAARLGAPARFGSAVLYLTVESPGLMLLHKAVAPLMPGDARGHEGDAYTPHLTLAVSRFGISAEGLDRMESEARTELPPASFTVTALRCYQREQKQDRWMPLCDLPLSPV